MDTIWTLNEQEYFQTAGLSVLLFHDFYPEGKQGGIELIQHGERVITNGDVRLESAQGQWGRLPQVLPRQVDRERSEVRIPLRYPELAYSLQVWAEGAALRIAVDLEEPLPEELVGRAGFNLELEPSAYWGRTYHLGAVQAVFPRQANGPVLNSSEGHLVPAPLAVGQRFSAAPEDPRRWIMVERLDGGELELYDGRNTAQDNWFVLRGLLAAGKTVAAVDLRLLPNALPGWKRPPVILISQVGYHPSQTKRALLELDSNDSLADEPALLRIEAQGGTSVAFTGPALPQGRFLRYEYASFDFSHVVQPGLYQVRYAGTTSAPFRIAPDVYQKDVWQPTLETFLPVQMCHMAVRDRYQVWHGACHLDDALQAPCNHEHFDGYRQGAHTGTPYGSSAIYVMLSRIIWLEWQTISILEGCHAWRVILTRCPILAF